MKVTLLLVVTYYLLNIGHSQCAYTYTNTTTQVSTKLDMSCLNGMTFDYYEEPYHFLYTPCQNGDRCMNDQESITGMVVQSSEEGETDQCFLIAVWDNSAVATYDASSRTWLVAFENGDDCFGTPRRFEAELVCDSSTDGRVMGMDEPRTCEYVMTINTRYACGVVACSSDDGISGGSVFLIIFFSGFFLYFVVGYLVMAFTKNKEGGVADFSNNIPQKAFWCMLPSLVLAGCMFSKDFIVGLCNKDKSELEEPVTAE
eukprot:154959_1